MTPSTFALADLYQWTVAEYEQMVAAGIIEEDTRVELIHGQIMQMSPVGRFHAACVSYLNEWLTGIVRASHIVRIQDSIKLGERSEPEPDLAIVKRRDDYYAAALPSADDIEFLIEVADSFLVRDREVKAPLYANFSIKEYWLIDLTKQELHRYTLPVQGRYQHLDVFGLTDTFTHPLLKEVNVGELFPWL